MRKSLLTTLIVATLAASAPGAYAATSFEMTPPGPDGSISGGFRNSGIPLGDFTDVFEFILPESGRMSGTLSSVFTSENSDIEFKSVTLNGVEFSALRSGEFELWLIDGLKVSGGVQRLVIRGTSGGNGTYAGTLSFAGGGAGAVPEPASWALMILGFGGSGAALRLRRRRLSHA